MNNGVSPSTTGRWSKLKNPLYWLFLGVLVASIVWVAAGGLMRPRGSEPPAVVVMNVPSPSASAASGAVVAPSTSGMSGMGGMSPSVQPSKSDEPSASGGAGPPEQQDANGGGAAASDVINMDPMSVCRAVYDAQEQPLKDAATSMDQWSVHVGAMNKLVTGAITLAQAIQFWNQTRVGAMANLDAFAQSHAVFQQRTVRCAPPADSQAAGDPLQTCQQGVAARGRELHLAREALRTWQMHVMHMEMLREGKMSPSRATQLWLQSWRAGQTQIDDYRSALAAAQGAQC